jgi:hypothetical protein
MSDLNNDKETQENTNNSTNLFKNIINFIISVIIIIFIILFYFSNSSLILFVCKLAQSNILPTEETCYPYTNIKPNIEQIKINIFNNNNNTEPKTSMKIEFPYNEYNASNKILDMFRNYKEKQNSNFLANYFISIIESLINLNYSAINTIMNSINELIPENIIIYFGPIIISFLLVILLFVNIFYFIYLWFSKMYWLFKKNVSNLDDTKPIWEDVSLTNPVDWCAGFWLVVIFIILLCIGLPILSIIPFLSLLWCLFSCIAYKSQIDNKLISSFDIIKDVLKYYKLTFTGVISFFIISLAFSNLGSIPGIFSIIILLLIYFGIISIDIFNPINEPNLTKLVNYKQAIKTCSNIGIKNNKQHGLLYDIFIGKGGGNNLIKQLKKINKIM